MEKGNVVLEAAAAAAAANMGYKGKYWSSPIKSSYLRITYELPACTYVKQCFVTIFSSNRKY